MKTPYISKRLEELLADVRSDINNGDFGKANNTADYIQTLGYGMTGRAIRRKVRTVQKAMGIS